MKKPEYPPEASLHVCPLHNHSTWLRLLLSAWRLLSSLQVQPVAHEGHGRKQKQA
jgi:hypothetical protein